MALASCEGCQQFCSNFSSPRCAPVSGSGLQVKLTYVHILGVVVATELAFRRAAVLNRTSGNLAVGVAVSSHSLC